MDPNVLVWNPEWNSMGPEHSVTIVTRPDNTFVIINCQGVVKVKRDDIRFFIRQLEETIRKVKEIPHPDGLPVEKIMRVMSSAELRYWSRFDRCDACGVEPRQPCIDQRNPERNTSMRRSHKVRRIMERTRTFAEKLTRACVHCESPAGSLCKKPSGEAMKVPHSHR